MPKYLAVCLRGMVKDVKVGMIFSVRGRWQPHMDEAGIEAVLVIRCKSVLCIFFVRLRNMGIRISLRIKISTAEKPVVRLRSH
jgi:hypothetical protein